MATSSQHRVGSSFFAYAQLVRLPNVFTAVADVTMGFVVTQGGAEPPHLFGILLATSVALYWAGMVLNDVFDVDIDRRERPGRPIPSGCVSLNRARTIGFGLLALGVATAGLATTLAGTPRPLALAILLAACILIYDARAKQTIFGPVVMGSCRTLNVLVGMSVAAEPLRAWHVHEWFVAIGVGVYIAGVTWFARGEAGASSRRALMGGLAVMIGGLALIGSLPAWTDFPVASTIRPAGWYLFWLLVTLVIARRCVLAIVEPSPVRVQAAVKNAILSLIVIDAGIVLAVCGVFWGCAVLLLLAPALLLGKWLYST